METTAGDVNDDGKDAFIVGDRAGAGADYLIFGSSDKDVVYHRPAVSNPRDHTQLQRLSLDMPTSQPCSVPTSQLTSDFPDCPAGFHVYANTTTTNKSCIPCPAGAYNDRINSPFCFSCLSGQYASKNGSVACIDCPANSYTNYDYSGLGSGYIECTVCPANTVVAYDYSLRGAHLRTLHKGPLHCS